MLYRWKKSGLAGRKFHENEKKERIFPIPSSTSRTLIRHSGFTLTLRNPLASSRRAIFFFLAYPTSLSYPRIPPSSYPCPHLSRCSQRTPTSLKNSLRDAGISDTLRHNRKCRGNAITCRKQIHRYSEEGRDDGNKRGNYESGRAEGREGEKKYCKEKRSRRNPFLREKDTYTSSVSFPRLIQHTKLIVGDICGKWDTKRDVCPKNKIHFTSDLVSISL